MEDYKIVIPDTVFINDFTIIYKGKDEKDGKAIEAIEEIKTSRDLFFQKLRYFKRRTSEMNYINEIYIHDEYSISIFKEFIESIKTKSLSLNENNLNILHQLSLKYDYYELQSKIEDFIKNRPDIQSIVNNISSISNSKPETQEAAKSPTNEIDPIKEEIISKHLDICLQNDNLMKLSIATLHRIFSSPKKILKNHHLLYEFVKKMIEKYESNQNGNQDPSKAKEDLQLLIGSLDYSKMTEEEMESLLNKNYLSSVFVPSQGIDQKQLKEIEERIQKIESTFSEKIQILEKYKDEKDKEIKQMEIKILHQEEIIKNYQMKLQNSNENSPKGQIQQTKPSENHETKPPDNAQKVQVQHQKPNEPSQNHQTKPNENSPNLPNKPSQNSPIQQNKQNDPVQQQKQSEIQSHNQSNKPSQIHQTKQVEIPQNKSQQPKSNEVHSNQQTKPVENHQVKSNEASQNHPTKPVEIQQQNNRQIEANQIRQAPKTPDEKTADKKAINSPKKEKVHNGQIKGQNIKTSQKLTKHKDFDFDEPLDYSSSTVSSSSSSISISELAIPKIEGKTDKLTVTKEYKKNDQFQGILSELTKINKGNPNDKGIVQISGNRDEDSGTFSSLLNYTYNGVSYSSEPDPNSFICFDFKEAKVSVSAYSIKSSNQRNANYLVSWVLEGSDDKNVWVNIDSHSNDRCLCSKSKSCAFVIEDKMKAQSKFRYVQIRMTGKSPRNNFIFSLTNIEFFGKYYSKE